MENQRKGSTIERRSWYLASDASPGEYRQTSSPIAQRSAAPRGNGRTEVVKRYQDAVRERECCGIDAFPWGETSKSSPDIPAARSASATGWTSRTINMTTKICPPDAAKGIDDRRRRSHVRIVVRAVKVRQNVRTLGTYRVAFATSPDRTVRKWKLRRYGDRSRLPQS